MKILQSLFIFLLLLLTFLLAPSSSLLAPAQAHLIGQPPFFKINGQYSGYYPVPTSSIADFGLPQDMAPETYLINQAINFEMDINMLPAPPEVVKQTKFLWDFGDGSSGTGLKNTHTYKKPGSYILIIKAQAQSDTSAQLLQSVMLNVLPSKDYKLPKAVIQINGWISKDPLTDILETDFKDEFKFDGSKSEAGSSNITSYSWDFGDTEGATGPKTTHKYTTNPYTVFPVLRVKTADGFIADGFAQIKEGNALKNPGGFVKNNLSDNKVTKAPNMLRYVLVGAGILVLIYLGVFAFKKIKK